ncbi:MAG: ATP-binding cassette domain-containing protein [Alphaproteobacteria bacterium]|nr:ATP-binding cassette domain-containing protein [Alphaproteobacteria bacterium]
MSDGGANNGVSYAIDARGLTKIYDGRAVVDHVDIQVPRGKIYGFLGPNGSGKTTSIRLLCGLLTPDDGTGSCLGMDLRTHAAQIKRRVGYMTQRFSLWDDLSIRENLQFVTEMYGLDRPRERAQDALKALGLAERAEQLAGQLSGGWKQRLSLAACTIHNPDLLLLDEPTAGVDPKARREFWDEIHRLAASGLTVLVSTHYMDEAERCHEIIYMAYGKIVARGSVDDVIGHAGLSTWALYARDLNALRRELEKDPAVSTLASFGESLHVSGTDAKALEAALKGYETQPGFAAERIATSLEDVFIHYMAGVKDNFA